MVGVRHLRRYAEGGSIGLGYRVDTLLGILLSTSALGPERQPIVAAGALEVVEGAPDVDEGSGCSSTRTSTLATPATRTMFIVWAAEGILQLLDSAEAVYTRYSKTHVPYQRHRVRQRTGEANTSAAPLDEDQSDP
ncbi:hypothetical protein Tco_0108429 [Tanacetum coccineum]